MTSFIRLQDTIVRVDRIFKVIKCSSGNSWRICIYLTDDGKSEDYTLNVEGSYKTAEERDKNFDRIANELAQQMPKVELHWAPVPTFGSTHPIGVDKGFFTGT